MNIKRSKRLERVANSIGKTFRLLGVQCHDPISAKWIQEFVRIEEAHGTLLAIKQLKAVYNECTRFACKLKINPSTPIWIKRDKENFPSIFSEIKPVLKSGPILEVRYILSLLRMFEAIKTEPVPDLSTVTTPSLGAIGFDSFKLSFELFLKTSFWVKKIQENFEESRSNVASRYGSPLHFSVKKGVSGFTCATAGKQSLAIGPKVLSYLEELNLRFRQDPKAWNEIIHVNQEYFVDHKDIHDGNESILSNTLGRIAFIPDKGGKTRLVAIGNYWVQDSLLGLHKTLYKVLSKIPQDGTYDQNSQFSKVSEAASKTGVWSYDLTAATDRFPIDPQVWVLNSLNKGLGDSWHNLLKSIQFLYEGNQYAYRVGQPMGLYGSWATFSLTHHMIIQYAAWVKGEKFPFNQYSVLGDDVAIWNAPVASKYQEILRLLDVTISEAKSFIPDPIDKPCVAEFAKRISYKGEEISGISPEQALEAWEDIYCLPEYLGWLRSHGFDTGNIPVSRLKAESGLSPRLWSKLVCLLFTWELLRSPVITGLSAEVTEEVKMISSKLILQTRLNLLEKQAEELWGDLYDSLSSSRETLEKSLTGPVPDSFYFLHILQTRFEEVMELEERLTESLQKAFESPSEEINEVDFFLSEIEYLPKLSFDGLVDSLVNKPVSRRSARGKYLNLLIKSAVKLLKERELSSL